MQVQVWRSFSSNNSSAYRLVARFESAEQATAAQPELLAFIEAHAKEVDETENYDAPSAAEQALGKKYGYKVPSRGYPLSWGDEGLEGDEPAVAISGKTLVMYHNYCGGLEDGFGDYLRAKGAKVLEEESEAPDVAVFFALPEGARGKKLREGFETYFNQKESGDSLDDWSTPPPWVSSKHHRAPYAEAEDVLYFSDGHHLGFQLPLELDELDGLQAYLKKSGIKDYRLLLCDNELKQKLTVLGETKRCPECNAAGLRYLPAASEKLEEDQILCDGCGGMFALDSAAKLREAEKKVEEWLQNKGVPRVCPHCKGEELPLRGLTDKIDAAELFCIACSERVTLKALVAASPAQRLAGGGTLNIVHGAKKSVFVASRSGVVFRSTGSKSFKKTKVEGGPSQVFGMHALSEQTVVVAGYGGICRSEDGAQTFSPVPFKGSGYLFSMTETSDGTLWLCGTGALWRSKDEGRSFTSVAVPFKGYMLHLSQASDKVLFAVGHSGTVLRSDDAGKKWTALESGVSRPLCRIHAFDEKQAVAVGDSGVIITTADGGAKWTKRKSPTSADIEGLTLGNDGKLYAVTAGGELLISENRGKAWEKKQSGASTHLWGIYAAPTGTLFMVGESGMLVRRDDLDVAADAAPSAEPAAAAPATKKAATKKAATQRAATKKAATKKAAVAKAPAGAGSGDALPTVGKSFLFTGKLASMSRAEAKAKVGALGGVAKSSVTKDLDYLVIGDEGSPLFGQGAKGSKMLAAEKLIAAGAPLAIISETVFLTLSRR